MTPEARIAAAIEVLDAWLAGQAHGLRADAALKSWGRGHRFAGSGDRNAIRDHVFDAIRCRRSFAALGGAETGRGLMIGALRAAGRDPAEVFGTGGHAPGALTEAEAAEPGPMTEPVSLDCPDWLWPDLGGTDEARRGLRISQRRAPIFLRVNGRKATRQSAQAALAKDEIATEPHPNVKTALIVTANPRRVTGSRAWRDGLVELQDAHSQAVTADLGGHLAPGSRVLDYCAGAGGKSLALAGLTEPSDLHLTACDILPQRLAPLPERAKRAGARISIKNLSDFRPNHVFDMVLCDAPCSGSGTWRRDPEGKWALTRDSLRALTSTQHEVLLNAARRVRREGGLLVYITCSVLDAENEARIDRFLTEMPTLSCVEMRRWELGDEGDGFFRAILRCVA